MKRLYEVNYAMMSGETLSYGYKKYTHALSEKQAVSNVKFKLGVKESKRMREVSVKEVAASEEKTSNQITIWEVM